MLWTQLSLIATVSEEIEIRSWVLSVIQCVSVATLYHQFVSLRDHPHDTTPCHLLHSVQVLFPLVIDRRGRYYSSKFRPNIVTVVIVSFWHLVAQDTTGKFICFVVTVSRWGKLLRAQSWSMLGKDPGLPLWLNLKSTTLSDMATI